MWRFRFIIIYTYLVSDSTGSDDLRIHLMRQNDIYRSYGVMIGDNDNDETLYNVRFSTNTAMTQFED
jgi:hypothetical protein